MSDEPSMRSHTSRPRCAYQIAEYNLGSVNVCKDVGQTECIELGLMVRKALIMVFIAVQKAE